MSAGLRVRSADGEIFEVDVEIAEMSSVLKGMLEVSVKTDEELPSVCVKGLSLRKVLEWGRHYKSDSHPLPAENVSKSTEIPSCDTEFFSNIDKNEVLNIISAANILEMKSLLDVACKYVANVLRGKTPSEIREALNIVSDFTPEEEEKVLKENSWWPPQ